jgi:hypothetical protein
MPVDDPETQEPSNRSKPAGTRWGGVVVPDRPAPDTNIVIDEPGKLLSDEERLQLDEDIARIQQRRENAVAESYGIRLS